MSQGNYTRRITEAFLRSVTPRRLIAMERLLVYDFDTGRSELLPRHVEGLTRHVLPHLGASAPPISVWIGGLASRRGDLSINIPLARRRATMVERFLFGQAPDAMMRHSVTARSFGEELSTWHTENSELYRSVLVLVNRPPPLPTGSRRAPVNLRSSLFNRFRIYLRWIGEGGGALVGGGACFIIDYDIRQPGSPPSDPVRYWVSTVGVGAGLPLGGSSADPATPEWNYFTSPFVTTTRGFRGAVRISSFGATFRQLSAGYMFIRLVPEASPDDDIVFENFQTGGTGISAGVSAVQGQLVLESDAER